MGSGASTGVAAAVGSCSAEELRAALSALPADARDKLQAALRESGDACVRIPEELSAGGTLQLSPFDAFNAGRSVPMVWFYSETLDPVALQSALQRTLVHYPVFSGRYQGGSAFPVAVDLNNKGVPLEVCRAPKMTLAEAISHIPITPADSSPSFFAMDLHEPFLPVKAGMDPDAVDPDAPLMKVKVTIFPAGGTAVGFLAQHGAVDADAMITFFNNWSRTFRGLPLDPLPIHERSLVNELSLGSLPVGEKPANFKSRALPPGEKFMPEFVGVMPKIMGKRVVVVPFSKKTLEELTASARAALPDGAYISVDDVLTAYVWQAMVTVRCAQLGLTSESEEITTCSRACNFRRRTEPPLPAGYCANGVCQVWTELRVKELLAMAPSAVAQRLRDGIREHTPETVAARCQWLLEQQKKGCKTVQVFDKHALTIIISSWVFEWESASFNATPTCFDHGALTPVVANFVPRPKGDGLNVYTSGTEDSTEEFARFLGERACAGVK